jgi:acetylornithine deacetylase/succinyl-diaminopimelate desuccinylase-like protein
MLTTANPFDPQIILDGIHRWVEIESPTDAPGQVNKLATMVAEGIGFELSDTSSGGGSDGNFTAPHTATLDGLDVDGQGAHTDYEQMYISSIEPRARLLQRLYQTLR